MSDCFKIKLLYYIYVSYLWQVIRGHQDREQHNEYLGRSVKINEPTTVVSQARILAVDITDGSSTIDETDLRFGSLPKLPKFGLYYYIISSTTHTFMFIVYTFLTNQYLDETGESYLISCLLPRLLIYGNLDRRLSLSMGWIFAALNLSWRFIILVVDTRIPFDLLRFLLVDDEILAKIRSNNCFSYHTTSIDKNKFISLRNIMFYRRVYDRKFILRPNRSEEAKKKLAQKIESVLSIKLLMITLMGCFFLFETTRTILYDNMGNLQIGCDIEYSSPVYIYKAILVLFVSSICFIDLVNAIFFIVVLGYYMTYDIMIYWDQLEAEIKELKIRLANRRSLAEYYSFPLRHQSRLHSMVVLPDEHKQHADHLLRIKVLNLQASLVEFFNQLKRVNKYVSYIITISLSYWILINVVLTLTGIQTRTNMTINSQLVIRFLQIIGLVTVTTISWPILGTASKVESSYVIICSLMANDQCSEKREWIKLLHYYTEKQKYSFTYFKGRVFDRLGYMKMISFSITFIFLVESFQIQID